MSSSSVRFSNPTAYQLRSLVLDYLTHQCYTRTAKAFLRDSAVKHFNADGDEVELPLSSTVDTALHSEVLREVDVRQEIRTYVLSGRIDDVTNLLNDHFPRVLSTDEHRRTEEGARKPQSLNHISNWSDAYHTTRRDYIAPHSLDQTHLSLNLRIQAFIEMCRTVSLTYEPSNRKDNPESSDNLSDVPEGQRQMSGKKTGIDREDHCLALLSKAKKLRMLVDMLPNPNDRKQYQEELQNVAGLLAYKEPEKSSSSKYMSLERREAVAEQIDAAVLNASDTPIISTLELVARHVSVAWLYAHEMGVTPQPGAVLPPTKEPAFWGKKNEDPGVHRFSSLFLQI
ncbi:hypothetical protein AX15_006346 [Amanita polypyramis BW_CC]|nr:hypothetical protein AX15_006346 [Amanita polypyramis BW_CC]